MKKLFNILILLTIGSSLFTFTSCSETEEITDYDNWDVRNQLFIDSIYQECEKNADGKWLKICAYIFDENVEGINKNKNHYIYVHKDVEGKGTYSPLFNDTVRVHFQKRLMPTAAYPTGYIFEKSYTGYSLDEKTDVPSKYGISNQIKGFTTALMYMVEGDQWTVYIPSYLGYGTEGSGSLIRPNSALVYDIKLAKIYRYGIDEDTTWY